MIATVGSALPEISDMSRDQEPGCDDGEPTFRRLTDQTVRSHDGQGEPNQAKNTEAKNRHVLMTPTPEPEGQEGRRKHDPEQHTMKALVRCKGGGQNGPTHKKDRCQDTMQRAGRGSNDPDRIRERNHIQGLGLVHSILLFYLSSAAEDDLVPENKRSGNLCHRFMPLTA